VRPVVTGAGGAASAGEIQRLLKWKGSSELLPAKSKSSAGNTDGSCLAQRGVPVSGLSGADGLLRYKRHLQASLPEPFCSFPSYDLLALSRRAMVISLAQVIVGTVELIDSNAVGARISNCETLLRDDPDQGNSNQPGLD